MKAVILVGGAGTRLRPLTLNLPKVLVPLNGIPLLQFILTWLRTHGIHEIFIACKRMSQQKLADFCGDGSGFRLSITYSEEEVPLGTAGAVKKFDGLIDETFVVVYGDVLTNFDLSRMIRFHKSKHGLATLALHKNAYPSLSGIVCLNEEKQVINFVEGNSQVKPEDLVNGGIYILERDIFSYISDDSPCDFGYDVFPQVLDSGVPIYGYALSDEEYLIDIGDWERYRRANDDVKLQQGIFNL